MEDKEQTAIGELGPMEEAQPSSGPPSKVAVVSRAVFLKSRKKSKGNPMIPKRKEASNG
jgi:hypothetical protein